MDNIEKLKRIGILGDLRQRLGAENAKDDTYDIEINELSNDEIMAQWSAWKIGDRYWWINMKQMFDSLEEMDLTTKIK